MNGFRKILFLISAFAMAAFALSAGSAFAGNKEYTLVMAPTSGTSPIATMTAKFTNQGNSSFNSLTLTVPANYALTGTPTASRGNVSYSGGVITILNINLPTGSGQSVTVTMSGVSVTGTCTAVNGNWSAVVWTGSTLGGSTFSLVGPSTTTTNISPLCYLVSTSANAGGSITPSSQSVPNLGTAAFTVTPDGTHYITGVTGCGGSLAGNTFTTGPITGACTVMATFAARTLSITSAPTSAVAGTPFDVTVGETPGGPTPLMTSDCSATATSTGTTTSTTFTITIPATATCNITFHVDGYTDASLPNFKAYKGVLACGDYDSVNGMLDPTYDPDAPSTLSGQGTAYVGPAGWGLRRGPNKDGSMCIKVNYSCDLNGTTNVASCTFDKLSGQAATFKYLFLWGPRAPDANGWIGYRPQVSWNIASPDMTSANAFMLPDWVPLLSCISDTFPALPTLPTTILPVIPGVSPFTDAANTRAWYQPGQTALVCGAQQGWTSIGSPPKNVQIWDILIDESDIVIKGPT